MSRLFLSKLRMETPGQVAEGSRIVSPGSTRDYIISISYICTYIFSSLVHIFYKYIMARVWMSFETADSKSYKSSTVLPAI
jgi:hypothetical protein